MDPRFCLLTPHNACSFYIHRPAASGGIDDSVAGPFCSLEDLRRVRGIDSKSLDNLAVLDSTRIRRVHFDAIVNNPEDILASTSFTEYELVKPSKDSSIQVQLPEVNPILHHQNLDLAPQVLVEQARQEFGLVVDGLFQHALCSMTRIVISARWQNFPEWVAITVRDREKQLGVAPDIALLKQLSDNSIASYVETGQIPSPSAAMAWEFHQLSKPCLLLHTHLLAPVVLDKAMDEMAVISEERHSSSFAQMLYQYFFTNSYRWVLRRGEGIWCVGSSAILALNSTLECQSFALDSLKTLESKV